MAVTAAQVAVGSSAVALNTTDAQALTLTIRNGSWISSNNVVLGPVTVTATTGYDLRAGETVSIPLKANDVLYAIAGTEVENVLVSVVRT